MYVLDVGMINTINRAELMQAVRTPPTSIKGKGVTSNRTKNLRGTVK